MAWGACWLAQVPQKDSSASPHVPLIFFSFLVGFLQIYCPEICILFLPCECCKRLQHPCHHPDQASVEVNRKWMCGCRNIWPHFTSRMSLASGRAHLTASSILCSPPSPTLPATRPPTGITLTVVQGLMGWSSSLSLPDPSVKPPQQTLHLPPTADSSQPPLIWLHAAEFSFLSLSPPFRLSWLHPLSKQSKA